MNITALSLSWLARIYMARLTNVTYSHDHNYTNPLYTSLGKCDL